jgi:hypothetical protein
VNTEKTMTKYLENDAVISDCGKYRYMLRRTWAFEKPRALLIMLNPSTADAEKDDATIRSCVRLLSGLGYGSMEVVNVFGYRATNPDELAKQPNPIGPMNERVTEGAIQRCDVVIFAWGAHELARRHTNHLRSLVSSYRPAVYCFGKTKGGMPKHPLYIKSGTPLEAFR